MKKSLRESASRPHELESHHGVYAIQDPSSVPEHIYSSECRVCREARDSVVEVVQLGVHGGGQEGRGQDVEEAADSREDHLKE